MTAPRPQQQSMRATPPKILQLISSSGYYGAERVLIELALYLREIGWDSRVGVFRHDAEAVAVAEAARRHGLPVVELACRGAFDPGFGRRLGDI